MKEYKVMDTDYYITGDILRELKRIGLLGFDVTNEQIELIPGHAQQDKLTDVLLGGKLIAELLEVTEHKYIVDGTGHVIYAKDMSVVFKELKRLTLIDKGLKPSEVQFLVPKNDALPWIPVYIKGEHKLTLYREAV